MITPQEIKDRCLKKWKEFLVFSLDHDANNFFPFNINKINKVTSKTLPGNFTELSDRVNDLKTKSSEHTLKGYQIIWKDFEFRKLGSQKLPDEIIIPDLLSFLHITGKSKPYENYSLNVQTILSNLPELKGWIRENVLRLESLDDWKKIMEVCRYFKANPRPNMYLRQLPVEVHTKFIEERKLLFSSLLEYLIPSAINVAAKKFEEKFNLLFDDALIRIRFLDPALSPVKNISYLSFSKTELSNFSLLCEYVIVCENKMNFLTLPMLPNSIAIWGGGGFSVSNLQGIDWLKTKKFYYWGDIDAHGFKILNQFRSYFRQTISLLMDRQTFNKFQNYSVKGSVDHIEDTEYLDDSEKELYSYVRLNNLRLEQEKITQAYVEEKFREVFLVH